MRWTKQELIDYLSEEYDMSKEELKQMTREELEEVKDEFSDGYNPMFPNGRDYDAEDEEGI